MAWTGGCGRPNRFESSRGRFFFASSSASFAVPRLARALSINPLFYTLVSLFKFHFICIMLGPAYAECYTWCVCMPDTLVGCGVCVCVCVYMNAVWLGDDIAQRKTNASRQTGHAIYRLTMLLSLSFEMNTVIYVECVLYDVDVVIL